jgi:ABC-type spermidine/putrescine transport system permease subunit II
MNEIIIALLALLIGAAIGGVIAWVSYRIGKRNGYAEGITRPSFGSPDLMTSLLPLILMAMPKGGMFSDYSQSKQTAE